LESKQEFANWIKNRIEKYSFVENQDYERFDKTIKTIGGKSIEYAITTNMAKEIAMVEGNEKGKQARQYFIQKKGAFSKKQGLSRKELFRIRPTLNVFMSFS